MARPSKTGIDYFPFDIDFFQDEKIICIGGKYGNKGEIIVIHLFCEVYRNGYYLGWTDQIQYKLSLTMHGVSIGLLNQVVMQAVKYGLFDAEIFQKHKVLTSRGIQARYFEATKKRKTGTAGAQNSAYLLHTSGAETAKSGVSAEKTPVSAEFTPQSKVKESKVKKKTITNVIAKKPDSHGEPATLSPEELIDFSFTALTRPDQVAKGAEMIGISESRYVELAKKVAAEWRITGEFDREKPRQHMWNTIARRAAIQQKEGAAKDPVEREVERVRARRERDARREEAAAQSRKEAITYEQYVKLRGADPLGELSRSLGRVK